MTKAILSSPRKIFQFLKREVKLYLAFRKLSHQEIEALRRQAALIEAARRRTPPNDTPRKPNNKPRWPHFELTITPSGLQMLQEVAA